VDELGEIVAAARRGDSVAVETLVDATYAEVWLLCATLVDRQAADDLTQETFARALRSLAQFRADSTIRTWMFTIARRACADEIRSRSRRRRCDERLQTTTASSDPVPDPSGAVTTWQLLVSLDPDRRAAFALTQLFRLTYDEAATVCDCPPGTIRSRIFRAREDLIGLLDSGEQSARRTAG
jgi:RNA polymerase sigma-70 factor (ECF subfamily)